MELLVLRALEVSMSDLFFAEGIDDGPEVLRSKIQRFLQTKDVKRLLKYYRLMLVSHEE
jgi:hypothetical protein